MTLTEKDVQEAVFTTSRKGYAKDEVDNLLDKVVQSINDYRRRVAELEQQLGIAAPAIPSIPAAPTVPVVAAPVPAAQTTPPAWQPASEVTDAPADPITVGAPSGAAPAAPAAPENEPAAEFQAGWYPDPWQQSAERYYDGSDWTAEVR